MVVAYTDQGNGYQGRAVVGTVDASNNSIILDQLLHFMQRRFKTIRLV